MAVKVGRIQPYDTGYRVMYGTRGTETFVEKIFPYQTYGGARKAKKEALKFWNSDDFQKPAKEMSPEGKAAKTVGLTFDEYVKLSDPERRSLKGKERLDKKFKLKQESGALDLKFTVNKKPYTITKSRKGLPPNVPLLKKFIKSLDKWKAGNKTLRSFYAMSDKLSNQTKVYWRQLANFAQGKDPITREGMDVKVWNKFFEDLKLPEEELNTLKTFTEKNYQKLSAERIGPKAWASLTQANPLTIPILKYLSKNPDATPSEFTKGIRAATGKKYSNEVIIDAAVNAHRGATVKMIKLGSGETIGETQLKSFKDYDENSLRGILKSLFHLYPAKMRRDFGLTLNEFLKDQPELRAEALERYKRFKQLERHIKDKIGFMGKKGLVEMDHPISFALLKKTGNLAESIRVNPIAQDINSWKSKLDKRLNMYQDRIAAGKNTSQNIKGLRALNELNQTLFGQGSPYFKVTEKGVSEIGGLPEQIYEGDLLKRFRKNLGLHKTLKTNIQNQVMEDLPNLQ